MFIHIYCHQHCKTMMTRVFTGYMLLNQSNQTDNMMWKDFKVIIEIIVRYSRHRR